jgi:glutaredoxin 3
MVNSIKVYGTPTCPWCKKAKQLLDENNVTYQDIDISQDTTAREEMVNMTGQITVPVIDIDGELAVGFSEKWIKQKLGIG